jgi:hypothetical protein
MENSLKEYDEAGKQFPFQLYEPLGKKHLDFHLDTRGTRLVVGGNRSGKSWMTLIEAVFDLVGWWPDFIPEANRAPQPCRLRIVSTSKAVRGRILTFLKQWIPRRVIRNIDARTGTITTFDGNVMELMTFDMDIQAFAGNSLHKCWIDEHLPYESIYNECRMRLLDVNGKMTVDICPWVEDAGGGFTWEYERLYLPAKKGDPDIGCHEFAIHDNPLLTKEQIEKEFSGLTEEEREAREFGRFVRPGGIIFKEYHDAHPWLLRNEVFTLDDKKTREWWQSKATLYWSIDPAATRPNAVLAIGVIGDAIYAVDEIFSDCTAGKLAEKMVKMEEYTGTPSCIIYDYNSAVEERTSGKSFIDVLKEHFDFRKYTWKPSVKHNEEGHIARIKQAFVQNKETGLPSFRVSERCRQFRLELCHWGRNPKTGQPDKKGNDMIDNARYIFAKIPGKTKYGVFEPEWMREARRKGM